MSGHDLDSGIAQIEMALNVARGRAKSANPEDRSAQREVRNLEQALEKLKARKADSA